MEEREARGRFTRRHSLKSLHFFTAYMLDQMALAINESDAAVADARTTNAVLAAERAAHKAHIALRRKD